MKKQHIDEVRHQIRGSVRQVMQRHGLLPSAIALHDTGQAMQTEPKQMREVIYAFAS